MSLQSSTPTAMGYRMPAEWERHDATWISWPHNLETWPDELPEVERVMAAAVRALAPNERVRINVLDPQHEQHVRSILDEAGVSGRVTFHRIPTNDAWTRDHGAIFVVKDEGHSRHLAATRWGYNAWGGKYPPFDRDNRVPAQMAEALSVPLFDGGMILEGGSIEVNGAGTLLTTESCLLNPNRNPHLSREEIESRLRDYLGVHQILWLGDGIRGDDTDGHIDDLTRFVTADTLVTAVEEDPADDNYEVLQENLARLETLKDPQGNPFRLVSLPMPRPIYSKGDRMPATYANFYVANNVVLLPAYNDPADEAARRILSALFPGRTVVPLDCTDVIWGLGAFHCLTQQVPAHTPVPDPV